MDALGAVGSAQVVDLHLDGTLRRALTQLVRACWQVIVTRPRLVVLSHVRFSPVGWFARLLRIPYVIVVYGIEVWGPRSRRNAYGLRWAEQVWAISQFTAEQVADRYDLAADRFSVLGGSVGEPFFELETVPHERFTMLTVSRLDDLHYKGIDTCLLAVERVAERCDCEYRIVGGGPALSELVERVQAMHLQDRVVLVGPVDDGALLDEYARSDVVVLVSRFRAGEEPMGEGLGLVLLEAAASGIPSIGATVGGTAEAVAEGESGFLVPAGQVEPLVDALLRLATDGELRRTLSRSGRAWAEANHSRAAFRRRVAGALSRILGHRDPQVGSEAGLVSPEGR